MPAPEPPTPPSTAFVGIVSPSASLHVTAALMEYVAKHRSNGRHVPSEIDRLTRFFALSARAGQAGPLLDALDLIGQSEGMPTAATDSEPQALPYAAAAARLGVSLRTVKRLVSTQALPVVRIGSMPRIHVADIDEYLDAQRSPSQQRGPVTSSKASSKASTAHLPKGA